MDFAVLFALLLNPNVQLPPLLEFLDAQALGKLQLTGNEVFSRAAKLKLEKHRAAFFVAQKENRKGRLSDIAFQIDPYLLVTLEVRVNNSFEVKCLQNYVLVGKDTIMMHKHGRLISKPKPANLPIIISIVGKAVRVAGHELERPNSENAIIEIHDHLCSDSKIEFWNPFKEFSSMGDIIISVRRDLYKKQLIKENNRARKAEEETRMRSLIGMLGPDASAQIFQTFRQQGIPLEIFQQHATMRNFFSRIAPHLTDMHQETIQRLRDLVANGQLRHWRDLRHFLQ